MAHGDGRRYRTVEADNGQKFRVSMTRNGEVTLWLVPDLGTQRRIAWTKNPAMARALLEGWWGPLHPMTDKLQRAMDDIRASR